MSFHQNLESIKYNAYLAIIGVIRCISKENLYLQLGLESLQVQYWYKRTKNALQNFLKQNLSISFSTNN